MQVNCSRHLIAFSTVSAFIFICFFLLNALRCVERTKKLKKKVILKSKQINSFDFECVSPFTYRICGSKSVCNRCTINGEMQHKLVLVRPCLISVLCRLMSDYRALSLFVCLCAALQCYMSERIFAAFRKQINYLFKTEKQFEKRMEKKSV